MLALVMFALIVGVVGGLAISFARSASFRLYALVGWCCLPLVLALVTVSYLGLKSGDAFATWPLLWVGILMGVPSVFFAAGAGLGSWGGRRAQVGRRAQAAE